MQFFKASNRKGVFIMKKTFKLQAIRRIAGIIAIAAIIGFSMVTCDDGNGAGGSGGSGGSGGAGGSGGSLSGSGVVWDTYDSGIGYVFRNGTMHVAANIGGATWLVDNAASYKYNNTHILNLDGSINCKYSISGNTLSLEGYGIYTKKTGQTLQWMDF
jgi:hypothetical protein